MNDSQKDIDVRVIQQLSAAGVAKKYHRVTLEVMGTSGNGLLEWMKSPVFIEQVRDGRPMLLHGESSYALAMVFARGCCIQGRNVKVRFLTSFMESEDFLYQDMIDPEILVVMGFYDVEHTESPLERKWLFRFEQLITERVSQGKMIVLQTTSSVDLCGWWSSTFRKLLEDHNLFSVEAA